MSMFGGFGFGNMGGSPPAAAIQQGQQGALNALTAALNANRQAFGGAENAAQQQYLQNAGQVQSRLTNTGLGNTTIAQTMQQAPLDTLNNALLNIQSQQQKQAADIYGQEAQAYMQPSDLLAQLLNQQMLSHPTPPPPVVRQSFSPVGM